MQLRRTLALLLAILLSVMLGVAGFRPALAAAARVGHATSVNHLASPYACGGSQVGDRGQVTLTPELRQSNVRTSTCRNGRVPSLLDTLAPIEVLVYVVDYIYHTRY